MTNLKWGIEFYFRNLSSLSYSPPTTPYHPGNLALPPAINILFSEWICLFAQAAASQGPPVNPAGTLASQPLGRLEDLGKIGVFVETNPVPGEYALASDAQLLPHSIPGMGNATSWDFLRDFLKLFDTSIYAALCISKYMLADMLWLILTVSPKGEWVGGDWPVGAATDTADEHSRHLVLWCGTCGLLLGLWLLYLSCPNYLNASTCVPLGRLGNYSVSHCRPGIESRSAHLSQSISTSACWDFP